MWLISNGIFDWLSDGIFLRFCRVTLIGNLVVYVGEILMECVIGYMVGYFAGFLMESLIGYPVGYFSCFLMKMLAAYLIGYCGGLSNGAFHLLWLDFCLFLIGCLIRAHWNWWGLVCGISDWLSGGIFLLFLIGFLTGHLVGYVG